MKKSSRMHLHHSIDDVVMSGRWSKNAIFGRCPGCHGMMILGVCQNCGWNIKCCKCGKTKIADGSFENRGMTGSPDRTSHGLCPTCYMAEMILLHAHRIQEK